MTRNRVKAISSGDSTLDELMGGEGFQKDVIYLLYGDKKKCANILLTTSVIAQKSLANGGFGEKVRVAYIDANNRFNPYNVSKFAVSQNLSPKKVLEHIFIARAFTWDQMVELLENKLSKLEDIKVVLISGISTLLQGYEKQTIEDLLRAINGIKTILSKIKPLIVLTAPMNEYSLYRYSGGKIFSHFRGVLVMINEDKRYTEYVLIQHPFLPENRLLKWKLRVRRKNLAKTMKNMTIDHWFDRTEEKTQKISSKKDREKLHANENPKSTEVNSYTTDINNERQAYTINEIQNRQRPEQSIGPNERFLFSRLSKIKKTVQSRIKEEEKLREKFRSYTETILQAINVMLEETPTKSINKKKLQKKITDIMWRYFRTEMLKTVQSRINEEDKLREKFRSYTETILQAINVMLEETPNKSIIKKKLQKKITDTMWRYFRAEMLKR